MPRNDVFISNSQKNYKSIGIYKGEFPLKIFGFCL